MNSVNLADILIGMAGRFADRPAIVSQNLKLTYAELIARSARSAREFRLLGVNPGCRVGIAVRDNGDAIVSMIALWMLGAVAVPIDFRTKIDDRAYLVRAFTLFALIEDRPAAGEAGYLSILLDRSWKEIIARHDAAPLFQNSTAPATIQLSSGTTGTPIGAVLDHERVLLRLLFPLELAPRNSGGIAINSAPLSFAMSLHFTLNRLLDGATVHFIPLFSDAEEFCDAILSLNATAASLVPTMLRDLLQLHDGQAIPLFPMLKMLYCAGGPTSEEEKRRARSVLNPHFVEIYASNLSGRISMLRGDDVDARAESVGRILPQVALQLVDDEDNQVPTGETGIIRVRSPGMANAILNAESRTGGDQIRNGWVYPGDLGRVDHEGFLTLMGRVSDVIIRGGVNIHPAEVERVLNGFMGVRESAVVGYPSLREGEEIAAFIVADETLDRTKLEAHCRTRLASDKYPRKFILVDQLPRNNNGKILRKALREMVGEGELL